jgi:hypothetical protein
VCLAKERIVGNSKSWMRAAGTLGAMAVAALLAGGCAAEVGDGSDGSVDVADTTAESVGEISEAVLAGGRRDITVESAFTKYGQGQVLCPSDMFAVGGGSKCTNGELDNTFPITASDADYTRPVPIGWGEWHRGASSNDCTVFAVCAPRVWFGPSDIKATSKNTGYGTGSVSCGAGFKAVGGGSRCTNGDLDMAYPNSTLSGWEEWHRGASSNDCVAHAVCVRDTHWLAKGVFRTETATGYGTGTTTCGAATALSGGAYCTNGDDGDFNFPSTDLSGWQEWHRGASSNDCRVSAVCLKDSVYDLTEIGAPCGTGRIRDCNKKCVALSTVKAKKADAVCNQELNCEQFNFDSGECF